MHPIDIAVLVVYGFFILGIGLYFARRNKDVDDYYVGGRDISPAHVGASVVATDVGGGFSIGLGGLGFTIGLSGSWLLFSGLLGAWLAAVIVIPRVKAIEKKHKLLTYPQIFEHKSGPWAALVAGLISALGYLGFTSSQLLAGAKLASVQLETVSLQQALWGLGILVVVYTCLGGLKAVIYTDTIQWTVLLIGLLFVAVPWSYIELRKVAGDEVFQVLEPGFLSLTSITWTTFFNWMLTIIPIWFVAMTLYQRIYACRDEKQAQKAWYIAGLLEWPVMAFAGVLMGLLAKVAFELDLFMELGFAAQGGLDAELGLPLLLRWVLPTGLLGLVLAAYLSAILSTADSCLMASSGNVVTDILGRSSKFKGQTSRQFLKTSQITTLLLGVFAIVLASQMDNVLSLMLHSYSFLVSGLFVPTLAVLISKRKWSQPVLITSMLAGGVVAVFLPLVWGDGLPGGLDSNFYGILCSLSVLLASSALQTKENHAFGS